MRIAIIERLVKEERKEPFEITYYLNNYYKEIFDELDILLIPVISENRLEEICELCDGLILTEVAMMFILYVYLLKKKHMINLMNIH